MNVRRLSSWVVVGSGDVLGAAWTRDEEGVFEVGGDSPGHAGADWLRRQM